MLFNVQRGSHTLTTFHRTTYKGNFEVDLTVKEIMIASHLHRVMWIECGLHPVRYEEQVLLFNVQRGPQTHTTFYGNFKVDMTVKNIMIASHLHSLNLLYPSAPQL